MSHHRRSIRVPRAVPVLPVALAAALAACGEGAPPSEDALAAIGSAVQEGSYEAIGVLRVANTLGFEALDDDVALDVRAARNIVEAREAEGAFDSIEALRAVSWVGDRAIGKMRAYAEAQGWIGACGDGVVQAGREDCDDGNAAGGDGCSAECRAEGGDAAGDGAVVHGIREGSVEAETVLEIANTRSLEDLDGPIGLDARAAAGIVEARPLTTLTDLDAVPYVGAAAFEDLLAAAGAAGLLDAPAEDDPATDAPDGPPYQDTPIVHGVREGSYEAFGILRVANSASLETLDDAIALDSRAAKGIFHTRRAEGDYADLAALDAVPYVGAAAFERLLAYAVADDRLPTCGDGDVQPVMEQCDGTAGCDDACRITYVCGDGVLEVGEGCDDGNLASNDGCSAACQVEVLRAARENRTRDTADEIGTFRRLAGTINGEGDSDWWAFTLDRPSRVRFDLWAGGGDNCYWISAFSPGGSYSPDLFSPELGLYDAEGRRIAPFTSSCGRRVSHPDDGYDFDDELLPGTYYFRVTGQDIGWGWDSGYRVSYRAEVIIDATGPVCGNGAVEGGEACDDGNPASNDGCSQQCRIEQLDETEPNGSADGADALGTYRFAAGAIGEAGDEDWYAVRLDDVADLFVEVSDGGDGCPFDAEIILLDADGAELAADDDAGPGYCPRLDPARDAAARDLPAGLYFVAVRHVDARLAGGAYRLEVRPD